MEIAFSECIASKRKGGLKNVPTLRVRQDGAAIMGAMQTLRPEPPHPPVPAAWHNGGALARSGATAPGQARTVGMHIGRDIVLCALHEVAFFEAQGKYTRVVAGRQSGLLDSGIAAVQALLPPDRFARIHRRYIVNLDQVRRIRRDGTGRMWLALAGRDDELGVARSHERRFCPGVS